ncbi:unnamed protein product [Polarella glacialis]|uniref:Uncharacterized protein n=1 Tax=Polarella glacialis TaxID=89957 RepID=A0A813K4P0_POLGL|nr:unnamed protein product [Polarella glacialis]
MSMANQASGGAAAVESDEEKEEKKETVASAGSSVAAKGRGKGKRAPNAEHCLPPILPEIDELCKKFAIEDKITRRLNDVMMTREDSFETDMKCLWEVCEQAKKPSGSLMVKIGELERGCFTGAGKLDQEMANFRSKFKLDDKALARFVDVVHRRNEKQEDMRQLERHLRNAANPSQAIMPLLSVLKKEGRLPSPDRDKDKDRDRARRYRSKSKSRSRSKKGDKKRKSRSRSR